jgi:hypothetical protein
MSSSNCLPFGIYYHVIVPLSTTTEKFLWHPIRANEKESWANDIGYMASYRVRETLLIELDGREEDDFVRMNDLGAMIQEIFLHAKCNKTCSPSSTTSYSS